MSTEILHSADTLNCACAACTSFRGVDLDVPADASLDPLAGGTANGKPIWTPEQIAAYLNRTGGQWGDGVNDMMPTGGDKNVITFGFHENQQSLYDNGYVYANGGQLFGLAEYFQFAAFNAAQRDATREAFQYWDDILAVSFQETGAYEGDINFGNLTNSPNTQAYSRIPTTGLATTLGGQVAGIAGDVWVSVHQVSNFQFDEGLYGMNTLVHEIGHSLGLSHPGGYNFGPGFAVTYGNGAEYAQDARNYSIMSYWNPRDMGSTASGVPTRDFDWSLMSIAYGSTPMVHDILAAQNMYGADMTTRTGDTVYGFNSNAGRDAFDFEKTPWPTMAIWDAAGNDTLDASGFNVTQVIDLTPGSLSSIGGITYEDALATLSFEQVNTNRIAAGYTAITRATYDANMAAFAADPNFRGRLTDNVGIAYGAVIENAKGGSGNDTIYGNNVDNVLTGNAGNDVMEGRGGNDTLDGGAGADVMKGGIGNDIYIVGEAGDVVVENAGEGLDTVLSSIDYTLGANVENLDLTGSAISGTGNELDNRISGNGLTNILTGGAGNDVFVAEMNDVLTASKLGAISVDILMDFDAAGDDVIDLSAIDADLTQDGHQAFSFVGKSSTNNAGDLGYKTYGNVNAAEKALGFDIDGLADSAHSGPITVIFGNNDADKDADFALVIYGTPQIEATDFLFA
ncbi:M10 family metallopeptidase C-terminal domain-containing protein [Sphingosinicella sp. LY1275]|uniref:M10 family metallopeptidase C-terminal domain-containing protein n=1 Tax=Sphingosinicella sp. LY1275 TaxID=3095379 RepID=UPI002ADED957|nr:M10 family metallopeptidase C-terminal domain-containing protein [Sphingosinicella sp. LY1275]MEA1014823.1 M10 family metallopeptidase C-terminal domain-containing protein [Sphingosinicella sp. LY1275]